MKVKNQETANSKQRKPAIFLYDSTAIEVVVQRSKRERRSMSAALACVVLDWSRDRALARAIRSSRRRQQPAPTGVQDTGTAASGQGEITAAGQEKEIHNEKH
jgi:hypothetical protein